MYVFVMIIIIIIVIIVYFLKTHFKKNSMLFTTITIKYKRYKVHIFKKKPNYEINLRKDIKYIVNKIT
jgi:hypothetical protein